MTLQIWCPEPDISVLSIHVKDKKNDRKDHLMLIRINSMHMVTQRALSYLIPTQQTVLMLVLLFSFVLFLAVFQGLALHCLGTQCSCETHVTVAPTSGLLDRELTEPSEFLGPHLFHPEKTKLASDLWDPMTERTQPVRE
jgi:hypothetical protein